MRVTASSFPNVLSFQLTNLATRQARLQTQAGTGQRFQLPSDDPRAMRKVLDLQTEIKSLGQYQRNIASVKDTLDASYAAINNLKKVTDRATEIATRADGLRTQEELKTFSIEVDQLIERALQLANTRHQGNYLFGGTKNTTAPFIVDSADRSSDGTIVEGGSVNYIGTATVSESEIAVGIAVAVGVPGEKLTTDPTAATGPRGLFQDPRAGANLFSHLIALRDNLRKGSQGDRSAVESIRSTDLDNLLKDEENMLFHFGNIGAIQSRLEIATDLASRRSTSLESLVSKEADADLAETLVALSEIQNAYQAALKTGGTILSQSLLDYIR